MMLWILKSADRVILVGSMGLELVKSGLEADEQRKQTAGQQSRLSFTQGSTTTTAVTKRLPFTLLKLQAED